MNPARGRLIGVGVATLVLGLVLMFPARIAYYWFAPPGVALSGIGGTVWSGRAAQISAQGLFLQEVTWRFRPVALLRGRLALDVEATPASGFIEATVSVGFSETLELDDLRGSIPLQSLERIAGVPGLRGNASLQFDRLAIRGGVPVAANGVLTVSSLIAPNVHRGSIGGYRAEFFTQNTGVMASVEDTDGVLDLAGSLEIATDRTYRFIAQLAPKANTPDNLRQQMRFLGTPNDRGQYPLRLEGQL